MAQARWALVLADGKPGHENQSLGAVPRDIAPWRFAVAFRSRLAWLRAWLAAWLGVPALAGRFPWPGLIREADALAARLAEVPPPAVVISAGSVPAPLNLLLARRLKRPAVTCMTPSVGLKGFDLALVPAHDRPRPGPKVVVTLGAPNRIEAAALAEAGAAFRARNALGEGPFVALLMGGEAPRHAIPPDLGARILEGCLALARARKAGLLVTTSRRTRADTEDRMAERAGEAAYFCRGRSDPESPVAGMLALAALTVVTEDSVSMVSEAASAPTRVLTVAVAPKGPAPRRHAEVLASLAAGGYVARTTAEGVVEAGEKLLAGPPPPVLDDTRRCREAVARVAAA